jgi:hypothetical protein
MEMRHHEGNVSIPVETSVRNAVAGITLRDRRGLDQPRHTPFFREVKRHDRGDF